MGRLPYEYSRASSQGKDLLDIRASEHGKGLIDLMMLLCCAEPLRGGHVSSVMSFEYF